MELLSTDRVRAFVRYFQDWLRHRRPKLDHEAEALKVAVQCLQRELDLRDEVAEWEDLKVSDSGLIEAVEGLYGCYKSERVTDAQLQARCTEMVRKCYGKGAVLTLQENSRGRCRAVLWSKDDMEKQTLEASLPWEDDKRQALLILRGMLRTKAALRS